MKKFINNKFNAAIRQACFHTENMLWEMEEIATEGLKGKTWAIEQIDRQICKIAWDMVSLALLRRSNKREDPEFWKDPETRLRGVFN